MVMDIATRWRAIKKRLSINGRVHRLARNESGDMLIATLVAFAIISITVAAFLNGLATTFRATMTADEWSTVESLARSQIEWVKSSAYVAEATQYTPAQLPDSDDYSDYSVSVAAQPVNSPDDGIQVITVTVLHGGETVFTLSGYKGDR